MTHPPQKPVWLPPPCGEGWGGGFDSRLTFKHSKYYLWKKWNPQNLRQL